MSLFRMHLFELSLALFIASHSVAQEPVKAATLAQVHQAVDWSKLPRPADASRMTCGLSNCSFATKSSFADVAAFFGKELPALGWVEEKEFNPSGDQSQFLSLAFTRGDLLLTLSGYKDPVSGLNRITVQNSGNVDMRKLPKLPDARFRNNLRTSQYFTTTAKPEDAAAFYLKELPAQGWRKVEDPTSAFHAKEGRTILRFVQNAMELTLVIHVNKEGQTEVMCSPHVRFTFEPDQIRAVFCPNAAAPGGKLAEYIKVLDARKLPLMEKAEKLNHHKKLMLLTNGASYQAPGKVADAAAFYRKSLSGQGWTEIPPQNDMAQMAELSFEKEGYLLTVGANELEKPGFVTVAVTNHGNIDLRQLPYPPGAEISPRRESFYNCTTTLSPEKAAEFYHQELPKFGWKEGKGRYRGTLQFLQNDVELSIEIQTDANKQTAVQVRAGLKGME